MQAGELRALRQELGWTQAQTQSFLGLGTVSTVQNWEGGRSEISLAAAELLRRELERQRRQVPILGSVPAGALSSVDEHVIGHVEASTPAKSGERRFAVRVRGDSMSAMGILDGALVICRAQETADDGAIIVARVDDEATIKVLRRGKDGRPELHGDSQVIRVKRPQDLRVVGRVLEVRFE